MDPQDQNVEKIKIGEQEFTQDELQELVGIGQQTREIEQKYNTKMDKVYPEFIKTTQKLKDYEPQVEELRKLKEQIASQSQAGGGLTPDQIAEARKQLISIIGDEPLTKKEAETWYQQRRSQEKAVEGLLNEVDKLKGSIKDGMPDFDKKELLEYMDQTGITSPESAYKIKYEKELDEWKMAKLSSGKRSGLYTMTNSSAGGKQPTEVRPTMSNINDLVKEALGPEY